ncbi:MAG: endonuclease Q family protein [Candidatus Verstraetearchaeota archaeon]|nr:endonuclease Q family protein [Candidatus Verstraetearchaeota archaeon]
MEVFIGMKVYADLHIHSKYSGGSSEKMNIPTLVSYALIKGLKLLGTGDCLNPRWLRELKDDLIHVGGGFYAYRLNPEVLFVVECEVGTVFEFNGKSRRVHHVILMPSLEVAEQLSDVLSRYGDVESNGRPVFNMHPSELVDLVLGVEESCFIFPAHIWTPWWSMFGSFSGVDRVEDCYGDRVDKIYAIETGLSSDPEMNWRVSQLHRFSILSFSDSHSPYPFRLGREACLFNLDKMEYSELIDAIKSRDPRRFLMTIEVDPAYGKYHWSGHRNCNVGPLPPEEARKFNYICPVCGRKLTKGVEDRVEELADKPRGFKPENAIPFIKVLPLQTIIAFSMGISEDDISKLNSGKVWSLYANLVSKFGSEFNVLLDAPIDEIAKTSTPLIASYIKSLRYGKYSIKPGFDGVYGRINMFGSSMDLRDFINR